MNKRTISVAIFTACLLALLTFLYFLIPHTAQGKCIAADGVLVKLAPHQGNAYACIDKSAVKFYSN
jgi:hypothetical protein